MSIKDLKDALANIDGILECIDCDLSANTPLTAEEFKTVERVYQKGLKNVAETIRAYLNQSLSADEFKALMADKEA